MLQYLSTIIVKLGIVSPSLGGQQLAGKSILPSSFKNMYRRTDVFRAFFHHKLKRPYLIPRSTVVFSTTGIGLATLALLSSINSISVAQIPPNQPPTTLGGKTTSQVNILFVNPSAGNDTAGDGSETAAFKTITHALRVSQVNTVIILAPGTYSLESGESFPLMLKPGVSIQGDAGSKGKDIIIQGGGSFISPTFASQNVAIVGANQAGLTGVTVTNTNPRGYGLWIESTNPLVVDNTFTANTHDGISVNGNAAPSIRNNYFYENGANGITIYGSSRPEVRENVFEKTGFAVNIAQNSAPRVIANRIIQNRTGVIVQAKARPVLRSNIIEDNSEDGLVALADAQPDLGTTSEPGSNTFRNNARYDINAKKAKQTFPAFGNTFGNSPEPERTVGNIDFAGTTVVVAPPPANIPTIQPRTNVSPRNRPSADSEAFPTPSSLTTTERLPERPTPSAVEIPVPPPETAADYSSDSQSPQNLMSPTNQSGAIGGNGGEDTLEFSAPGTLSETTSPTDDTPTTVRNSRRPQSSLPPLEPAPVGEAALLPVPDANIPLGSGSRRVSNPRPATNRRSPSTPRSAMRVVVEISNAQEEALVREIVPEAFRSVDNGQVLMQVGVFSNRNNAEQMVQKLNSNGLKAKMEPVNQ